MNPRHSMSPSSMAAAGIGGASDRNGDLAVEAVGIGALAVCDDRRLVTYGIGSCVAISAWDRVARIGGLLHFMLPGECVGSVPEVVRGRYASTGLPVLFDQLLDRGSGRVDALVVCAVGGAAVGEDADVGQIGARNVEFVRRALAARSLRLAAEVLGGTKARGMDLDPRTGVVAVRDDGGRRVLWHELER